MKMSKEEVRELGERVRSVYRELVQIAPKFSAISSSFEDRYHSTISTGGNEGTFLYEELLYAQTLLAKELKEQQVRQENANKVDHSVVEKELEKYSQKIAAYPQIEIPGVEIDSELAHLFGALAVMDKEYWVFIERFFRERYPIRAKSPMEALSNQFIRFISASSSNVPQVLGYYVDEIRRGDDHKADDIAFAVIKEVAFFLNEVIHLLDKDGFDHNHSAYVYLTDITKDFRLTEIKRRPNS